MQVPRVDAARIREGLPMTESFLGFVVGLILGGGIVWRLYTRKRGLHVLLAALLCAPVISADDGWYTPISYVHIGDETATVSWETARDPSLRVTSSAYGAAVGLGYQWTNGLAISAQV